MKLFGKNDALRTENGKITRAGYMMLAAGILLGACLFLVGRMIVGKALASKNRSAQE